MGKNIIKKVFQSNNFNIFLTFYCHFDSSLSLNYFEALLLPFFTIGLSKFFEISTLTCSLAGSNLGDWLMFCGFDAAGASSHFLLSEGTCFLAGSGAAFYAGWGCFAEAAG